MSHSCATLLCECSTMLRKKWIYIEVYRLDESAAHVRGKNRWTGTPFHIILYLKNKPAIVFRDFRKVFGGGDFLQHVRLWFIRCNSKSFIRTEFDWLIWRNWCSSNWLDKPKVPMDLFDKLQFQSRTRP